MKKILCVLLSVLLTLGLLSVAFAADAGAPAGGSFSVLCYNVAGLPDISFITGGTRDVPANQRAIGAFVSEKQYDIFAAQEDFGYHDDLVSALDGYEYSTFHRGIVPFGDGTSTFTRTYPMYNEAHIEWNSLYGIADDGADQLSTKGITYTCINVAPDVYIDFYNIHADAYGDEGSLAARRDNFTQLRDLINGRDVDRAVIVTGDFNAYLYGDPSGLKEILIEGAGLKDAWVEFENGGDYDDCSAWLAQSGESWADKWGRWDSVERFLYKDGGGVTLNLEDFGYLNIYNGNGEDCSDHVAAEAVFSYTVSVADAGEGLEKKEYSSFLEFFRRVFEFFRALLLGLGNLDKVVDYLQNQP
ncbi:MAG: hypothetical protein IK104_03905 [Clostridia bacterium]|nr:hypothetical protein [Clostridia bacterium]